MIMGNLLILEQVSRQVLIVILNASLKGFLIITCVYILFSCIKKVSAQTRHLIWFLSIAGFIILPCLSLFFQPFRIGVFRLPENPGVVYQTFASVATRDLSPARNLQLAKPIAHQASNQIHSASAALRWTLFLIVWLAGALTVFLRSNYGKVQAKKIVKIGEKIRQKKIVLLFEDLCKRNNLDIFIPLYVSTQVSSPFTFRVFKPIIVIPEEMVSWSKNEIKPVLLHEIHHIKRRDYLTQTMAALICAVFWFVPAVWIALKQLYAEQENSCDEGVIQNGINPRHYVRQMVRLACSMVSTTVNPGLSMVTGRRKTFERRIINILKSGGKTMKKKNDILTGLAFILVILAIAGCATTGKAVSGEDFFKIWSGTWVNTEIEGSN